VLEGAGHRAGQAVPAERDRYLAGRRRAQRQLARVV
jgi:hypothetical protein